MHCSVSFQDLAMKEPHLPSPELPFCIGPLAGAELPVAAPARPLGQEEHLRAADAARPRVVKQLAGLGGQQRRPT